MPAPWPGFGAGTKRVKIVLSGWADVIETMFGRTQAMASAQSVASANILCMSTQMWTAVSPGAPWRNSSLLDMLYPLSPAPTAAASRWFLRFKRDACNPAS